MKLNKTELYDADLISDLYEERAAIIQYDGGFEKEIAEQLAAQALGFKTKQHLNSWLRKIKEESQNYV